MSDKVKEASVEQIEQYLKGIERIVDDLVDTENKAARGLMTEGIETRMKWIRTKLKTLKGLEVIDDKFDQ
ncbi:hypothetical protein MWH28_12290 [Natroniella sulfidigena]|uniref:hypothetical protein n=1 Tax=Natroniella sulfidigena TaxID=723921 RepID=UPI00200AEEAD|nr:hypothetical protein [Natroniella sulfidigena]MCK8818136.1 hypothetical protein [Natroniella sulfidigena]